MANQNYCMINEIANICDNVCVWDGNPNTWTPPPNYLMLIQADVPAKVWQWNAETKVWYLAIVQGAGGVGYTWDGMYLITNSPQPTQPPAQ